MEDGVIVEDAPPEEFFEHPKNERIRQFIRKVEKDNTEWITLLKTDGL